MTSNWDSIFSISSFFSGLNAPCETGSMLGPASILKKIQYSAGPPIRTSMPITSEAAARLDIYFPHFAKFRRTGQREVLAGVVWDDWLDILLLFV